ncbi:hypothetical protein FOL47_004012 [Perkinsus chesapeaki]|uniref:Phytase-like domain-containing protein n=1 Tax=Perkinsus chesapeaki TaxID=330153 RepID=A0A7J6M4W4_PERCH|nr:hypothetical protein FOL47_004012 [Perkinsus chesapeaki]
MVFNFKLLSLGVLTILAHGAENEKATIKVETVPFKACSPIPPFESDEGTLRHVTTSKLTSDNVKFGGLSSLIITPDGSEILAVSDSGVFVTMPLSSVDEGSINAEFLPMKDAKGDDIVYDSHDGDAEGLTVNGFYEGSGKGELYVSYEKNQRVMKFPKGVSSDKADDLGVSILLAECPHRGGLEAIVKLRSTGQLLMVCEEPNTSTDKTFTVSAWARDAVSGATKKFSVQSENKFFPTDMAELPNGDIMILLRRFVKNDRGAMQIGYITAESIQQAITNEAVAVPKIILELWERDGWKVDNAEGLAARQDPKTNKTFVYTLSDDNHRETQETLLTTFEWIPKSSRPDPPSYARGSSVMMTVYIGMGIAIWSSFWHY